MLTHSKLEALTTFCGLRVEQTITNIILCLLRNVRKKAIAEGMVSVTTLKAICIDLEITTQAF